MVIAVWEQKKQYSQSSRGERKHRQLGNGEHFSLVKDRVWKNRKEVRCELENCERAEGRKQIMEVQGTGTHSDRETTRGFRQEVHCRASQLLAFCTGKSFPGEGRWQLQASLTWQPQMSSDTNIHIQKGARPRTKKPQESLRRLDWRPVMGRPKKVIKQVDVKTI